MMRGRRGLDRVAENWKIFPDARFMPRLSIYSSDAQRVWTACNFNYSSQG